MIGWLAAHLADTTAIPLALVILSSALLAWVIFELSQRNKSLA